MQVNVEHRLARVGLAVEHKACAAFFDAEFLGNELCAVKHLAHQFAVGRLHVHDGRNMALGHYQKVYRSLRGDVVEGEHVVIFVDFLGRDFSLDDFAEKTIFTHSEFLGRGDREGERGAGRRCYLQRLGSVEKQTP